MAQPSKTAGKTAGITSMVITFARPGQKPRKKYAIGATRVRGKTTYIKQERIAYERGKPIGYMTRRGRHLCEWVVKDGPLDREGPNFDRNRA